ncbi:hypothetical protein [Caballeronia sp. LZ034LL]|uniref:hypothetical protein n=1 Tax=Caballeronia sp. LZ034LL TaxID=3038567 RepID=UPI00285FDC46|nr:hypothetical protein [Caballeronia sp. LZ034LL]MDR5836612.1 hypothetical protein [Caballeronia sp. LZ034LL]
MTRDELYDEALRLMEDYVHHLDVQLDAPQLMTVAKTSYGYRYAEKGAVQAMLQKMARLVSALRAVRILLAHGFVAEQAAVCRIADEASEDVNFLALGIIHGETYLHKAFIEAFNLEEFEDADRLTETATKRPSIPRDRIHAYLTQNPSAGSDPSTGKAAMKALHKTYSGYVHGASPHIMETYGGNPARFHMNGMLGTPLLDSHVDAFWSYMLRGLMSFAVVAKASGDEKLFASIRQYCRDFEASATRKG